MQGSISSGAPMLRGPSAEEDSGFRVQGLGFRVEGEGGGVWVGNSAENSDVVGHAAWDPDRGEGRTSSSWGLYTSV